MEEKKEKNMQGRYARRKPWISIAFLLLLLVGCLGVVLLLLPDNRVGQPPLTDESAIDQRVKADITLATIQGGAFIAGYSQGAAWVAIDLSAPVHMEYAELLALIQNDCFTAQQTLWQDPLLRNMGSLDVSVISQNHQGRSLVVGECTLDWKHASTINWTMTDAITIWNARRYTHMFP